MNVRHEEGFTLIEVLVAFAILSSAIIIGLQIHEDGLRRLASGENQNRILAVARYELAKLNVSPISDFAPKAGATDGVNWIIVIEPIANNDQQPSVGGLGLAKAKIFAALKTKPELKDPVLETLVLTQVKPQ